MMLHFEDLVENMAYNSNMQFYQNLEFVKKVFDYLQLLASRNNFATASTLFPLDLLRNIIRL